MGKKTGKNPTDRGKLGVKRSVLADGRGVVLGLCLAAANCHDSRLAEPTMKQMIVRRPQPRPRRPQHLCADKAYDSQAFRQHLHRRHYQPHIKSRGQEMAEQKQHRHGKARRWVNERTQSWFNRFRRVLIRRENKAKNDLAILHFTAAWIAFRRAGVLG